MNADEMQIMNIAYTPNDGSGYNKGGIITGVFNVKPKDLDWRLCYQITYPNGEIDYVPLGCYNISKEGSK